ncbi:MAG: hypothetical protein P8M34_13575 [Saprospiraceae bacterium]|nr:hypothetical protein [Saprospiraceae bacterium]|tara:strand:- start:904 stop:1374 length:471 start_codon:yes stop_codon:yes gene_type:complete
MTFIYRYSFFLIVLFSCNSGNEKLVLTDLLSHGEAIKVMAPKDAHIIVDDYGLIKDIIITDSLDYSLQIFISRTNSLSMSKELDAQKEIVRNARFFSKFVVEEDEGFIYEKNIDDDLRYDFRYIRIQADKQYVFQPSLSGGHNEEHVRRIYEAVKQ